MSTRDIIEGLDDEIRWTSNDLNRLANGLAMPTDTDAVARTQEKLSRLIKKRNELLGKRRPTAWAE